MKKIVLTTEQAQRLFNIINEEDRTPNFEVQLTSNKYNPGEMKQKGEEVARNLGGQECSITFNTTNYTGGDNDNAIVVPKDPNAVFGNQVDDVAGQMEKLDTKDYRPKVTNKGLMEQKRIANIKKNGYTYSKKDFDTFLMN